MTESLGEAVLTLDADQGPLNAALNLMDSQTRVQFAELGAKLKNIFGSNMKAGMVVAGAAVVAAVAIAGKALYDLGSQFDAAYDRIRVGTGKTGTELAGLKDDFRDVVKSVPTDFGKASDAVALLNKRLGLTGQPLRTVAKQVLELSRLTGTELGENIESLTRLFGDWGVKNAEMAPTIDRVFRLSQSTGIGVSDLSRLMVQFGSPLRQLGLDFDTAAAMFAKFEKEGVNIQAVMPGLKMGLKNLSKPTGDAADVMERLGITSKDPAKGLQQTMEAIKGAGSAAEANRIAFAIFGTRAGPDLAAAVREGRFELSDLMGQMRAGKETVRSAAEDTNDLSEQWQLFRNNALVKLEPVATRVFELVNQGLAFMMDNSATVLPVVATLFGVLGAAALVAGAKAAWSGAVTVASWVAAQAASVASAATQIAAWTMMGLRALASAAQMAAAWLIALGPIGWAAAAVIAIAALIIANWDWVKRQTETVWNAIKDFLVEWWPVLIGLLLGPLGLIVGLVIKHWDKIKAVTSQIWGAITGAVVDSVNWISRAVVDGFMGLVGFIASIPRRILDALGDLSMLLYNAGKAVVTGLFNGIKAVISSVFDFVGGIAETIKSLKGPLPEDMRLLQPEGEAIITGLGTGMERQFAALQADIGGYAPIISGTIAGAVPASSSGVAGNESQLAALATAIDRLVDSGTAGVLEALTEAVSERQGYDLVGRRQTTAGDGSVALS